MTVSSPEIGRRMKDFLDACREAGLKVTHQRTEIFRELAETDEHPDAETIYGRVCQKVPAVSRDTVYRTLGLLEERGLITRAEIRSGPARYDANTNDHHHFFCMECGRIRDIYSKAMDNFSVPASVKKVGTVRSRHVQLRGVCSVCIARGSKS